ncbi:Hint domain-containing protein [Yoonia sp. BS5-3]|uniref:Hint domain-containing protein n=1 Tax=Yoonia phaeophyticola TaxID=3137369 RepID=A0ABZ2V134_9RHOB
MTTFTLDWSSTNIDGSNTVSDGGESLDVTVATPTTTEGENWFLASFPDGTIALAAQTVDDPTPVTLSFDDPVENVSFELFDVDARLSGAATGWDDKITIIALNADGEEVPVTFTDLADHHSVNGNVLDTDDNASTGIETSGAEDTVTVTIAGPIVSLEIIYDNDDGPESSGAVGISDVTFSPVDPDGYVEGTSGNDLINTAYDDDPDGDQIENSDAILPGEAANDDIVIAGGGDDTVRPSSGDDTVFGGAGEDDIRAGGGADTIYGDNPSFDGVLDLSGLSAGDLVENQFIEDGVRVSSIDPDHPVMVFDSANPTGGDGDLSVPSVGNVLILTEDGDASDPDDDADGGTFVFEFAGPTTVNSVDLIAQSTGEIRLYDEEGNLVAEIDIPAGADNTLITQAINIPGVTRMELELDGGGAVTNLDYTATNDDDGNDDYLRGNGGDDTIFGQAGNDEIFGDAGDDTIDGGSGADIIDGGSGADTIYGGTGSDVIIGGTAGDVVVGGEDADGNDIDVLDLSGADVDFITYTSGDPEAGVVTFADGSTMTFSEIERVIPCFTPGTRIATPKGERLVENLQIGDRVLTRDNGIRHITWVGTKVLQAPDLELSPKLRPVLIRAGALGNGLPERDMMVSPNHRMLIVSELAQLYFGETEVLVAAKHMTKMDGVETADVRQSTYVHFMCDNHEVVLSNGAWTESFQPGDYSLKGVDADQREELFKLFPELATKEGLRNYRAARKSLKRNESKLVLPD